MGKAIVGKLLHEPTICLRELPPDEDISSYIEVVQDLYGIQ
jgi:glutamyl-tRNA reductase